MPLQQRDFREATAKITETAVANVEGKMGYSNYWCIVSAGAPGIGIIFTLVDMTANLNQR
ncbi:hypothetical protein RhiirA1_427086 [Rhizophagus irregularis]|uniref:Uncharacterized protein n=1 Tax=Rhizophagus irregularis TaxID=588596 RepID=A0A2N0R7G1_9GLOM|nr:hypothetical protein RhiirA1_427086 [Rhizophagus irregularis]